jgi:hypothetical protein
MENRVLFHQKSQFDFHSSDQEEHIAYLVDNDSKAVKVIISIQLTPIGHSN